MPSPKTTPNDRIAYFQIDEYVINFFKHRNKYSHQCIQDMKICMSIPQFPNQFKIGAHSENISMDRYMRDKINNFELLTLNHQNI